MTWTRHTYRLAIIALVLTSFSFLSCDNSIDPFVDTDTNFGLFGFLDSAADTQFVRVEISRETQARENLVIPSMISQDLGSGIETTWNDSLITLNTGEEGLIFWTRLDAEESGRYQIEVAVGNAAPTVALVDMPSSPNFLAETPTETIAETWEQKLLFTETPAIPDRVTVRYFTQYANGQPYVHEIDYFSNFITADVNAWSLLVRIERDLDAIRVEGGFSDDESIRFNEARITLRLRTQEWLNGSSINSNVTNGFGFIGSVITFDQTWPIDTEILLERNFSNGQ